MSSVNSMRMVVKFSILGPLGKIESEVLAEQSRYFAEIFSISRILKQRLNILVLQTEINSKELYTSYK